jgi:hypothetical protein
MVLLRLVVNLFLLASLAEGKITGSYRPQGHRELQTLVEPSDCIQFDDSLLDTAFGSTLRGASPECDSRNACSGGCCRFHTKLLVCDEDNDIPHQAVSVVRLVNTASSSRVYRNLTTAWLRHRRLPLL